MNPSVDIMALHQAAKTGMIDVVEALLARGTNPNARNESTGKTVAHCAVEIENMYMLKLLKEYGADMSIIDYSFNTPLCDAVQTGKVSIVEWLLDNITYSKENIQDMLYLAAAYGQDCVVHVLLSHGADMEARNDMGRNALYLATESGNCSTAKFLLHRGAEPFPIDDCKKTLLHAAAGSGDLDTMSLVFKFSQGQVNVRDGSGETPLHCAATTNRDAVAFLLDRGADVHLKNDKEQTALDLANRAEKMEIVDLLSGFIMQYEELTKGIRNL